MHNKKTLIFCYLLSSSLMAQPAIRPNLTPTTPTQMKAVQNLKLPHMDIVTAGGSGGNLRTGEFFYDGLRNSLPSFTVSRNGSTCYATNNLISVYSRTNGKNDSQLVTFPCAAPDPQHNNLYWSGRLGTFNGGYSPANDVLYASEIVNKMFNEWYGIPPSATNLGPVKISLVSQVNNSTAFNNLIDVGIGYDSANDYPLTSLDWIASLYGFLFTEQHSALAFESESGGIFFAFSNMTAMAAEYYATGTNTWMIGAATSKSGKADHYIDMPSKNCDGRVPGDRCDIDNLCQYVKQVGPYYSSGLYSRAFYLLATTTGWNTRKSYDVFVQANRYHWNSTTNFHDGACGAINSARSLGYDTAAVTAAFGAVGINTSDCL